MYGGGNNGVCLKSCVLSLPSTLSFRSVDDALSLSLSLSSLILGFEPTSSCQNLAKCHNYPISIIPVPRLLPSLRPSLSLSPPQINHNKKQRAKNEKKGEEDDEDEEEANNDK